MGLFDTFLFKEVKKNSAKPHGIQNFINLVSKRDLFTKDVHTCLHTTHIDSSARTETTYWNPWAKKITDIVLLCYIILRLRLITFN